MSDVCFLVEDLERFERALNARGIATRREAGGALIVNCSAEQARAVAGVARVRLRAQWPTTYQLAAPPAALPSADAPKEEEQP